MKAMRKGDAETLNVTKRSAAQSQLECAIWLWFNGHDPVSIHALAIAAHDCFDALVKHATRKRSLLQDWLSEKSKERQKRVRIAQNFFKHGAMDLKSKIQLHTIDAETFMMDAVTCYELLGGKPTPLMRLYMQRFLYEHPTLITENALPVFAKNAEVHQLADSTRKEFFELLFPEFLKRYADGIPRA